MTDQDRIISPAIAPYIERVAQAICTGLYPEAAAKGRTWPDFPAATRTHLRCIAQNVLVALEAAVLQPIEQIITTSMLNRLIDLGGQASAAHAKSNSDDGAAGTEAAVRFFELREQMRALLAPAGAAQESCSHEYALAFPHSFAAGGNAVCRLCGYVHTIQAASSPDATNGGL